MHKLFILALTLVAIIAVAQAAEPCEYKFASGPTYDFGHVGTLVGKFNGKDAFLNLCENVSTQSCPGGGNSICVAGNGTGDDISFASKSPGAAPPNNVKEGDKLISKQHSGKEQCYSFGLMARQLSITIECGPKNGDTFEIVDLGAACQFETTITVQCENGGGGLSGGAIFLIIFFSVLAGYFVIGFLVCKFVMKKEGVVNSIPQNAFWCALPGLYIAGIKFVIGKFTKKGGNASSEYSSESGYGSTEDV